MIWSNDLVSRSEVLKALEHVFDKYRMSWDREEYGGFGREVPEAIRNLPIAYDIDWVKDQLEKKSNSLSPKSVRFVFLKDAKETVDTGGIDEGVMRNENSECD